MVINGSSGGGTEDKTPRSSVSAAGRAAIGAAAILIARSQPSARIMVPHFSMQIATEPCEAFEAFFGRKHFDY